MKVREALVSDIPAMQRVRHAVNENRLSDPALVPDHDVHDFISRRGKGWVCEISGQIVGFAIADLAGDNIWALFLEPQHENRGIGRKLQQVMLDWYFAQGKQSVWLGTAPGTRAEGFYRHCGWTANGMHGNELRFEMTNADWQRLRQQ